jgi:hypothetical protein
MHVVTHTIWKQKLVLAKTYLGTVATLNASCMVMFSVKQHSFLKIEKKKLRTLAALFCPVFTTVNDEKNN